MESYNDWKIFETTGKIEDYLKYAEDKKVIKAQENFVSLIEGDGRNGRNGNGNGNSDFLNGYK